MGGRTRVRGVTLVVAVWMAVAVAPVVAQTSDYRSADPRALVQAWALAPQRERGPIVEALITRRAQSLPALWEAARFGTRKEKVFACGMIAEMRDRDGIDALVDASGDADVHVRRRAATALRILADQRSAPRLRAIVRDESDLGVLKTALAALG